MAGVSIDDFGASFIDYMPGVTESLNNVVLLRKLARNDYRWEGKNISFFVHTARNHGLGNLADGGTLPSADKQDYVEAKAFRRFLAGSVQVTDGALANAASSKRAARDVVTSELRGMLEGMAKYDNFMSYRDGTGVVCNLGLDVTAAAGEKFGVSDARLLWDGATYQLYDTTLATNRGDVVITSVDRALNSDSQPQVTSTNAMPAGATATTDKLVWNNSLNLAVSGLDKMIDDNTDTFQNVNNTTYPRYTSPVLSNSGTNRPLTPTLFRRMLAMIRSESGMQASSPLTVLSNSWQGIEVEELYESDLRLAPSDKVVGMAVASFQSVFGRIDVVLDNDAPYNKMFFVDFSQIYRAVQKELDWSGGTRGIFRRHSSAAAWVADALEIYQYFIKQRNRCGKIEDLSETIGTAY